MAALLKDEYTLSYIKDLANCVAAHYPDFQINDFITAVFDEDWQNKELKARTIHIAQQLNLYINLNYVESLVIIQKVAPHFTSYTGMFIPAFVEIYGLDYFTESIQALEYITQYASAEFAVRPFIVKYPDAMQKILLAWTFAHNEHTRRLASEGSRPRLPWAMALPEFKKDPSYLLPILENLKIDNSEYVRRSVANNLNDIAKDHPKLVTSITKRWLEEDQSVETKRLIKHVCRSLLKQAAPDALSLFGFLSPEQIKLSNFVADTHVCLGGTLNFAFCLQHQKSMPLKKLRIEFAIDFMKKNGKQARKIFQLSESTIEKEFKQVNKSFSFKAISTRKYYCGQHSVAILVNGVQMSAKNFILEN